jgi:hypothetical protein
MILFGEAVEGEQPAVRGGVETGPGLDGVYTCPGDAGPQPRRDASNTAWLPLQLRPAPNSSAGLTQGDAMAEQEYVVVYAASYPTVAAARAVLDTIEHLRGAEVDGPYDAAVIAKENGQPHVVKRLDHPRSRIIPEWFGGGALTRKELNDAAEELVADEAGLVVVGEATIEPALDKVFTGTKVVKREIEATIGQITGELQEAFKA